MIVGINNAPFAFCTNSTFYGKTISAKVNEEVELTFLADNQNKIAKTELFVDFDKVYETEVFQSGYALKMPNAGLYTINVEYTSMAGFKCASQLNLKIEN